MKCLYMVNKITVGEIDQNIDFIKSRFIDKNDWRYPGNILHIFAENPPVKRQYDNQLKHMPGQLITVPAKDEVPKNSKISDIREAQRLVTMRLVALYHYLNQKLIPALF